MKSLIWAFIGILIFILAAVTLPEAGPSAWDTMVRSLMGHPLDEPGLLFKWLHGLGSTAAFIAITLVGAVIIWLTGRRAEAAAVIGVTAAALGLNIGLKALFARIRPEHNGWIEASGYSFPSGNAMVSMALYGMLIYVIWTSASYSFPVRAAAAAVLALLILGIGLSRLVYGVHYASDIAAGYGAGLVCVAAAAYLLRRRRPRYRQTFP